MKIFCNRCKEDVEPVVSITTYKVGDENKEHIRADCPLCEKWIKWLSKIDYENSI